MSLLILVLCAALMFTGLGLVHTRHLLFALVPLGMMLILVAVTGIVVMAEIGMVAVLGAYWRWSDQHPVKKDEAPAAKAE